MFLLIRQVFASHWSWEFRSLSVRLPTVRNVELSHYFRIRTSEKREARWERMVIAYSFAMRSIPKTFASIWDQEYGASRKRAQSIEHGKGEKIVVHTTFSLSHLLPFYFICLLHGRLRYARARVKKPVSGFSGSWNGIFNLFSLSWYRFLCVKKYIKSTLGDYCFLFEI